MADVTIDSNVSPNCAKVRRAVVTVGADTVYFFFVDSDNDLKYYKSTNGGASVSGPTTIYAGTVTLASCWYDRWTPGSSGTKIHVMYVETDASDVRYRALDTSDDSLGTEVVAAAGASAAQNVGNALSFAVSRGGNVFGGANIDNGTETFTFRSTDGGASFSARTNFVEANIDWFEVYPGNAADNQDMTIVYFDASVNEMTVKDYDDSANSYTESSSFATVVENTTDNTGQYPFTGAVRKSDRHVLVALVTERDAATGDFRTFDIDGSASIVEKGALATDKDDVYYPSMTVDDANDDVYVWYSGKRDGSETLGTTVGVYYSKSTDDMATWSAGDTAYSAGTGNYLQTWAPLTGRRGIAMWRQSTSTLLTNADNSVAFAATYTASAALTAGAATLSGSVDLTNPVYAAAATLAAGAAALSASSAFDEGTFAAAAQLTAASATLAASGDHDPPVWTAAAALAAAPTTLSSAAEHDAPVYAVSAALVAAATTLAASGDHDPPVWTVSAALSAPAAALSAAAEHDPPTATATAALSAPAASSAASVDHDAPASAASVSLSAPAAAIAAGADFGAEVAASASLTAAAAVLVAFPSDFSEVDHACFELTAARDLLSPEASRDAAWDAATDPHLYALSGALWAEADLRAWRDLLSLGDASCEH
jgi:hypothetical protein